MCFGGMETTKEVNKTGTSNSTSTSTTGLPDWVKSAGQDNYNFARQLLGQGYQPYTGPRVAPLSANEKLAGSIVRSNAVGGNPYERETEALTRMYGNAPAVWSSVIDENGPLGSIQNYMNPHLRAVLDPMLREIGLQGTKARQNINRSATMSGAFGDARHGVVEGEQRRNEAQLASDVTGKGWSDAFNQALGLRTGDLTRYLGAENDRLNRARTSAIDLTNLDKYGVSRDLALATALGTTGENERKVNQAGMDKGFEEHLRKQGWSTDMIGFLTKILGSTPIEKNATQTQTGSTTGKEVTSAPDNSGWGILGSLAGTLLAPMTGGLSLGMPALFGAMGGGGGGGGNPNIPAGGFDTAGNAWGSI